jgi:hypothetical protein
MTRRLVSSLAVVNFYKSMILRKGLVLVRPGAFKLFSVLLLFMATLMYSSVQASARVNGEPSAAALPTPSPETPADQMENSFKTLAEAEKVKGKEARSYKARAIGEVKAAGTHVRAQEGEAVAFPRGRVSRLEDGTTLVVFPLTGGQLTHSALTVSFSPAGDAHVFEMLLREISSTSGSVEYWVDGKKAVDQVVDSSMPSTKGWSQFVSCLNSSGVAAWLVTAISIACSAICVVTAGTACVACIAAAAGATSGAIGYCIKNAL